MSLTATRLRGLKRGPAAITWNVTGGCAVINPTTVAKTSGSDGWDSQAYSTQGYVNTCVLTFKISQTNANIEMGLNNDPATDANYTSIDYGWMGQNDASSVVFEGSSAKYFGPAYTSSTVFKITYDGTDIKYYLDNVEKWSTARAVGAALYIDSSFHTGFGAPCEINSITFSGT